MDIKKFFAVLISAAIGANCLSGVAFAETELPDMQEAQQAEIEDNYEIFAIDSSQVLYSLYSDAWNGATTKTDSSKTTARNTQVTKYGDSGTAVRLKTTGTAGSVAIYMSDGSLFKDINQTIKDAATEGNAYFGCWLYWDSENSGTVSLTAGDTVQNIDTSVSKSWQFVSVQLAADTEQVEFSFSGGDCIIDELCIYMEAPSDTTPVVSPAYYDADGNAAESTAQCVSGYFDIGFNFPVKDSSAVEFAVESNSTGETAVTNVEWQDSKTARINLEKALEFETEYTVTISNYENIYGGVLNSDFTFKTLAAPIKLDCTETMNTGMVSSAQIGGSLTNTTDEMIEFTLYALAKVNGQTISVKSSEFSVAANSDSDVNMTLTFESVNSEDVDFTYFMLDDKNMPVNNVSFRQASAMTVDSVEILGNVLSVDGSFSATDSDRCVVAVISASETFNKDDIVSIAEARTENDGTFLLTESLYDGLESGTYTVFVWGEGDSSSQKFTFNYSSLKDREEVIDVLLNDTAAEILECMNDSDNEEILDALGIIVSDYNGLSEEGKASVSESISAASNKSEQDLASVINSVIALQIVNESGAEAGNAVLNYSQYLLLSDTSIKLLDIVSDNAQGLSDFIGNSEIKSTSQLDSMLSGDSMILWAVSSVSEQEQIHKLLTEFSDVLGFDADVLLAEHEISESDIPLIFTALIGKSYTDTEELKKAFNIAMYKYIEGPPYGAESLSSIFTDSVQGGYISTWNGSFSATEADDRVKAGEKSLYINPTSGYSGGVIWLNTTLANNSSVKNAFSYGTAYIGMWIYVPTGFNYFEMFLADSSYDEHTKISFGSKRDDWQFVMQKITKDVQYIMIKSDGPTGVWLDDIRVYSVPPEDPTAEVSEVKFYDRYQEEADSQNQFVGTYFDVVYNFPTQLSRIGDIVVKNKATGTTVKSEYSIENGNIIRITPDSELEYNTEYTVTIGKYENVFGGKLDGYTFDFKTCLVPMRFENTRFIKADGNISSASLIGTLCNDDRNVEKLTIYLQASVSGETTGLAYTEVSFAQSPTQSTGVTVNFPETDSSAVQLSYFVLTDDMLPISIIVPQPESEITLDYAKIVGKSVTAQGSFADNAKRAVTAVVAKEISDTYSPEKAVSVMQTTTDENGKFTFTGSLSDNLDTGYYTIFIWGEGADKVLYAETSYAGGNDRQAVVNVLSGGSSSDIAGLLNNADNELVLKSMGTLTAEYGNLTSQKAAVAEYVAGLPVEEKNTEAEAISALNSAIVIAYIKETTDNPTDLLIKYAEYIDVDDGKLYLINSIVEDSEKERINNLLKTAVYSDAEELNTVLENNLLLMAINTVNSNNHIKMKQLLTAYKNEIGFDAASLISANNIGEYSATLVYQGMLNQNFNSFAECQSRFNALIEQYKPKGTPGSSGGSGGSGGGGSGKGNAAFIGSTADVTGQSSTSPAAPTAFADIKGHWAEESITYLFKKGFVNGKDGINFCPADNITREEFIKILINALGLLDETAAVQFADVPQNRWSYAPVASAYKLGIVNGYPNGTFGASDLITREDMAVMVSRAVEAGEKQFTATNEAAAFADGAQISEYAKDSVNKLRQNGIINGNESNEFMPKSNSTRAEAVQVIYNLLKGEVE